MNAKNGNSPESLTSEQSVQSFTKVDVSLSIQEYPDEERRLQRERSQKEDSTDDTDVETFGSTDPPREFLLGSGSPIVWTDDLLC